MKRLKSNLPTASTEYISDICEDCGEPFEKPANWLDFHKCQTCANKRRNRNKGKGTNYLSPLPPGEMPKPARIKARARQVIYLRKELEQVESIKMAIMLRDPRTVTAYYEALAIAKIAYMSLEKTIKMLEEALV